MKNLLRHIIDPRDWRRPWRDPPGLFPRRHCCCEEPPTLSCTCIDITKTLLATLESDCTSLDGQTFTLTYYPFPATGNPCGGGFTSAGWYAKPSLCGGSFVPCAVLTCSNPASGCSGMVFTFSASVGPGDTDGICAFNSRSSAVADSCSCDPINFVFNESGSPHGVGWCLWGCGSGGCCDCCGCPDDTNDHYVALVLTEAP